MLTSTGRSFSILLCSVSFPERALQHYNLLSSEMLSWKFKSKRSWHSPEKPLNGSCFKPISIFWLTSSSLFGFIRGAAALYPVSFGPGAAMAGIVYISLKVMRPRRTRDSCCEVRCITQWINVMTHLRMRRNWTVSESLTIFSDRGRAGLSLGWLWLYLQMAVSAKTGHCHGLENDQYHTCSTF